MRLTLLFTLAAVLVACESTDEPCACSASEEDFVCGDDGVTYDSMCLAECAGVDVLYEGSCDTGR